MDKLDTSFPLINGTRTSEFSYDGLDRRVRIIETENDVEQSNHVFIWDGSQIAQKRDSAGSTVQRNYFADGFSAHSASSAVNYFYTKDHLGSIREVVASDGLTIEAVYDYSPWGEVTKVGGSGVESDFLYTGHFYHDESDLHLTLYRAYDPALGMWLSRDPIAENGGINLHAYVGNNPVNYWDPYGLNPFATALSGLGAFAGTDAAVPDPSDAFAPAKAVGYLGAAAGLGLGYAAWEIGEWLLNRNKACAGDDCHAKPAYKGDPNSTVQGKKQTRRYGPDGLPETDRDLPHSGGPDIEQKDHVHDWGSPTDRGPARPPRPGDPPPPLGF